jgi:hypothetical protein
MTAASAAIAPIKRRLCDDKKIPVLNGMVENDPKIQGPI